MLKIKSVKSHKKLFVIALFLGLGIWGMIVYNYVYVQVEQSESYSNDIQGLKSFLAIIVLVLVSSFPVQLLAIYDSPPAVEHADIDRKIPVVRHIGDLIIGSLFTFFCSVVLSLILLIFKIKMLFGIPTLFS